MKTSTLYLPFLFFIRLLLWSCVCTCFVFLKTFVYWLFFSLWLFIGLLSAPRSIAAYDHILHVNLLLRSLFIGIYLIQQLIVLVVKGLLFVGITLFVFIPFYIFFVATVKIGYRLKAEAVDIKRSQLIVAFENYNICILYTSRCV